MTEPGWRALLARWTEVTERPASTLYDDVTAYAAAGPDPDVLTDEATAGFLPYAVRALQAATALAAGVPHPAGPAWAVLYVGFEAGLPDEPSPWQTALRMPAGFARATIDHRGAWDAFRPRVESLITGGDPAAFAKLDRIAARAGHPSLVKAVWQASVLARGRTGPVAITGSLERDRAAAHEALAALPEEERGDRLDREAARLLDAYPDRRADVVAWWSWRHVTDGRVAAAERALDRPIAADEELSAATRARLAGSRAGVALRRGRAAEAVRWWRRALAAAASDANLELRHWAGVNLARAVSEEDPDEAFALLTDAAYGPDGYGADAELLAALAVLQVRRDDLDAAVDLLGQAIHLANDHPALVRDYAAQRCQLLIAAGRAGEAVDVLTEQHASGAPTTLRTLLAETASWAMLLAAGAVPPGVADRLRGTADVLAAEAGRARERGDVSAGFELLAARAGYVQLTAGEAAGALWDDLVRLREESGVPVPPEELVRAARVRDRAEMRRLLAAVPAALARRYGSTVDIDLLVREPRALLRPLAELAGTLLGDASAADLRLVAELQRDAVGRARIAHRDARLAGRPVPAWRGEPDPRLAGAGPVVVVEWVTTGERTLVCLMTRVGRDGTGSVLVPLAAEDPFQVRTTLEGRLAYGADPLGLPAWQRLATSLLDALDRHAHDGDHVVVLHSEAYANLPWHAAIGERWTVSYAAGWGHLHSIAGQPPAPRERLGVCHVPLDREEPGVARRLRETAGRLGGTVAEPDRSDRSYLAGMLGAADVAVLLCHGYRARRGHEVGVLLADDGRLPPAGPAGREQVRRHLFGWRDAQRLPRAARTVLSAACSTAYSYGAGLGDRLGLAGALRYAGTTALVAPVWDAEAAGVLPVLAETTERYRAGEPLARALRSAAAAAASTGTGPTAWSLALEGDWR